MPVLVQPGQADGTVAVELGYGRRAAGRVGNGVGVDLYRLRTSAAPWFAAGASLTATGARVKLALTQELHSMEGRHLVREASLDEYRRDPRFVEHEEAEAEAVELWQRPPLDGPHQWGMTIDLAACTGCNACVVACQSENNVPVVGRDQVRKGRELLWLRVDRYYAGDADEPEVRFQPVPCMHCENAPCEEVCPVAATVHDAEGINAMVYNRCIGTRYCSNNCPYKVRRFNYFNFTRQMPEIVQMAMNPDVTVRSRGVMEKCTYCLQRINEGKAVAKRAGRRLADGEVRTACQQTCPAEAITFGDLADPQSAVSRRKRSPRNYTLLAELNNLPRTSYLARVGNPNPEWPSAAPAVGEGTAS
jgi:molybdopterin-containing oxidoreductase family iron-sulfur binding subunit